MSLLVSKAFSLPITSTHSQAAKPEKEAPASTQTKELLRPTLWFWQIGATIYW